MARKTHIVLVDDIDGSEATQTISFALDGVSYEIDLNDSNATALQEDFSRWVEAARRVAGRRSSAGRKSSRGSRSSSHNDELRAWARANGYEVKDRGRVSQAIRDAYAAASNK